MTRRRATVNLERRVAEPRRRPGQPFLVPGGDATGTNLP